jgi:hypothetical protein
MFCTAELIPHTGFHKGSWIKSASGWYYFIEEASTPSIFTNLTDYDTVDPQIVGIVKYLHSKGIATTPSCQGHFDDAKHYKKLYTKLRQDAEKIVTKGLSLSNEALKCKYGNKAYKLPWTESEFINKVLIYQTEGVVGFVDPNRKYYDTLQLTKEENINIIHDNNTTLILVKSATQEDMINNWKTVERLIKHTIGL